MTTEHTAAGAPAPGKQLPVATQLSLELVHLPLGYNEACTTSPLPHLTDQVMDDLEGVFKLRDLPLSPTQLLALRGVVSTLSEMAEGVCPPRLHISDLGTGMGKTTALIQFLKRLVKSEDHGDVGVVVCLSRLDEIKRLVEEAGLDTEDFSVLSSDAETNSLSSTPRDQAQVLFTTQQMLQRRCAGGSFAGCRDFYYLGRPRQVRVWDETMEPGEVISLSTDDLGGMLGAIRPISSDLADLVQSLQITLLAATPGGVLEVPEVPPRLRAEVASCRLPEEIRRPLDKLLVLSGKTTRVLGSRGDQRVALDIRDVLPRDLAPVLVLDASARVRRTYTARQSDPAGPSFLPSAPKDYSALTIHVLDAGGGKDGWKKNGDQLAQEIATLIDSKPGEPSLVIHHKAKPGLDTEQMIRSYCETDSSRVSFLPWGRHQATNTYKDVPNVILAGLLHLPESQYLGLAHASTGRSVEVQLPPGSVRDIMLGELGHAIVQAVGRGTVRGCVDGRCLPCNAYIIGAKRFGLRKALQEWFPGARVKTWRPKHKPLGASVKTAVEHLEHRLSLAPADPIFFAELMEVTGYRDRSNFKKRIRDHPDMKAAIERLGLEEVSIHSARGCDAYQRPFGPVDGEGYVPG